MSVSYTIESIENGVALVRYADNSWAEIVLESSMTAEDLDDKVELCRASGDDALWRKLGGRDEPPIFSTDGEGGAERT